MRHKTIRVGFCTDLTGPYRKVDGLGGAEAIRMAIEDVEGEAAGSRVELLLGDHHNDSEQAKKIAFDWYTQSGVDLIISGVNSDTSLAMSGVAADLHRPLMVVGAGTSVQTRERASSSVIQYAYNTVALATVPGLVLTSKGDSRWFYITADYPFGRELEAHGRVAVSTAGGTVVGAVINPHGEENFVPYIEAALESGAQVLGLANGHAALIKAMKAMELLGATSKLKVVGLLTFIDDIYEMGQEQAKGLYLCDSWYWTRDAESRAWAHRFFLRQQRMPSSLQAADYSAVKQYLQTVKEIGSTDPDAVTGALRSRVLDDMYVKSGRIREDGMMLHEMYLLKIKEASLSSHPWDCYDLIATVSGDQAFPTV